MDPIETKMTLENDDVVRMSTSKTLVGDNSEPKLYIDHKEESKLLLKLDLHIAPVVMILYMIAFLDRSNIGYANVQGMSTDINLTGNQFNVATSIFYVTYVLIETPAAVVVKSAKFSRMIPAVALGWGLVCLCTGFIQNYPGLLVTRLLLGAAEGGLFPSLTLYLMSWYKRDELAKRMCFLFGAAAIAGAFGGLIAFGILHMDGAAGYAGWRWLYIIEGAITIVFAFSTFWLLPDKPEHAYFLNARDKEIMATRLEQERIYAGNDQFAWREVKLAFKDLKLYISAICQFGADVCLYGFSTFLPIIIQAMGYDSVSAQYLTIPVYIWGAIVYFIVAWWSDRLQKRGIFLAGSTIVTAIGYIVLLAAANSGKPGVLYFATYLVATGLYVGPGLNITWLGANVAPHNKRSAAIGFQQTLANTAGVVAGQIYMKTQAPQYIIGHAVSLGSIAMANIGFWVLMAHLRMLNTKKARMKEELEKEGKSTDVGEGDRSLEFKYHL